MRRAWLLASLLLGACCHALEDAHPLAHAGGSDPVLAWKKRAESAAQVVEEALRRQDKSRSAEVKHVDLESLRIWNGQRLELALEVDSNTYTFFTESEPEWHSLSDALPAAASQAGAVVPKTDWEALERNWVVPVTQGPLLPDFTLEGPLDLYLRQPTALQLFLPHSVDVGRISRVLLRDGASVTVRGARSVGLRRPVDLPSLSLGDFASLVTADAEEHPASGILHLLSGVRSAAVQRWNVSHPDLSLAVVALELEFSRQGGALLAAPAPAPAPGGDKRGLQRLKPRKLKEGVVELSPRDSLSEEETRALALLPGAPYAWPLRVHPQHLQAYERLLREVLSSQVFSGQRVGGGKGSGGGVRVQEDLQLRLHKTQAEAMTLLELRMEVDRKPKPSPAAKGGDEGKAQGGSASGGRQEAAAGAEAAAQQRGQQQERGAAAAGGEQGGVLERPPDTLAVLVQPKTGPHEVWDAVVQVKQDPESGALRFVPVRLQRADATRQTVSFSPSAVAGLVGNITASQLELLAQQAGEGHGGEL